MTLAEVTCHFDHPVELSPEIVKMVLTAINTTRWRLGYYDWIEKLGVTDDNYWREKWSQFESLDFATRQFDPGTLYRAIS